jgi:hypothetical protein
LQFDSQLKAHVEALTNLAKQGWQGGRVGASGMAKSARFKKSRFSAGGPVRYLSLYLLDFYITVSIFILHNLLLLDSKSFLLDSKSTFIIRSRAKHFGYPRFFDHKS